jgi:hypothetical protein
MVLFQEFISDPKTSSYSEDKQQGLHQENTWPMINVCGKTPEMYSYWNDFLETTLHLRVIF